MATLRDIKKRISSVKSTQKITKAMKMVAAAKLRRAQMAVIGARPYCEKMSHLVVDVLSKQSLENLDSKTLSLFTKRESVKKVEFLVFSSNRGLCGGFNSNLLRRTESLLGDLSQQGIAYNLNVIGKKGREFFKARHIEIKNTYLDWAERFSHQEAQELIRNAQERFLKGEIDEYHIIYNKFISAIKLEIVCQQMFPFELEALGTVYDADYIYEPSKQMLLDNLLPKYFATQIYKAHLESLASELGSRMSAMDNATNNAVDMISRLTLQYNRARQSSITMELMDIVNGAESLKG